MRSLHTYSIMAVVFAICFAITGPLFSVYESHDNIILELLETEEENQTEHEENKEELVDDDFKNDFYYGIFGTDLIFQGQFMSCNQLPEGIFSGPSSPPPEQT